MTSITTEKQEVGCSYRHRLSRCSLLTVSKSFLHPKVLEAPSEIITMNRQTVRPKGYLKTLKYIYSQDTNLIEKECPFSSAAISRYSINYMRKGGGYSTVSTHLSLSFIFTHPMYFRQRKGGGYNTDSTYLSQLFISITFYGRPSMQRCRLQYRLNTPFTVVYFHHILRTSVNAKVEATIPTQHTFHSPLLPSHSMDFRHCKGEGYNTDSTHLSQSFISITFYGLSSLQR